MKIRQEWLMRRFYEFRAGHATYLVLLMSFSNFILIFYRLLVEQVPYLSALFTDLWLFAVMFLLVYIPFAVLVGHWHRRKQLPVEQTILTASNPEWQKLAARLERIEALLSRRT